MPRRTIDAVNGVMEFLRRSGFEQDVPAPEVKRAVELMCGAKPQTVERYINYMKANGFITVSAPGVFRINYDAMSKIEALML